MLVTPRDLTASSPGLNQKEKEEGERRNQSELTYNTAAFKKNIEELIEESLKTTGPINDERIIKGIFSGNIEIGLEIDFLKEDSCWIDKKDQEERNKNKKNKKNKIKINNELQINKKNLNRDAEAWKNYILALPEQESRRGIALEVSEVELYKPDKHLFFSVKVFEGEGLEFELQLTTDKGVLEWKVLKAPFSTIKKHQDLITEMLYEVAKKLQWQATPLKNNINVPMVHLNIDLETAFNNKLKHVCAWIESQEYAASLTPSNFLEQENANLINAVWMKQLADPEDFKKIREELRQLSQVKKKGGVDFKKLEEVLQVGDKTPLSEQHKSLVNRIPNTDADEIYKGSYAHYRAINIDHLSDETPAKERRVEYRRIIGVEDFTSLMEEIEKILHTIYPIMKDEVGALYDNVLQGKNIVG